MNIHVTILNETLAKQIYEIFILFSFFLKLLFFKMMNNKFNSE